MWEGGLEGHESTGFTRLSPSFSIFPYLPPAPLSLTQVFAQHPLIWGILRLSQPWWGTALQRSESSPESYEYPCLCSLKGSTSSTFSASYAEKAALSAAGKSVSESKLYHIKQNITACWLTGLLFGICLLTYFHNSSVMIGIIGFKMIFIVKFGKKSMLFDFTAAHLNVICIHWWHSVIIKHKKNRCWL